MNDYCNLVESIPPRARELALWPPAFRGELDFPEMLDSMQRLKMNPFTSSSPSFSGVIWRVIYRIG
jgi:hypothetical protein